MHAVLSTIFRKKTEIRLQLSTENRGASLNKEKHQSPREEHSHPHEKGRGWVCILEWPLLSLEGTEVLGAGLEHRQTISFSSSALPLLVNTDAAQNQEDQ